MDWVEVVAWVFVAVLAIPLCVLGAECFLALWPGRPVPLPDASRRPRCVVLIPAHNEELDIATALRSVGPQMAAGDRILVVADNCTDATAEIARSHGVQVVERNDPTRRAKGYALAFGRDALKADPPEVVVVLDADCTLSADTVHRITAEAVTRRRPIQSGYRMVSPPEAGPDRQVAAFGFVVKNLVRPLGLRRVGLPCLLMGTGMAFPWELFRDADLGHAHIAEDLALTVDLGLSGQSPVFIPDGEVVAPFPIDDKAAAQQRRRWEHGHLRVLTQGVPRLLSGALFRGRLGAVPVALEFAVPPLSALVMMCAALLAVLVTWAAALGGPWGPAAALGGVGLFAALGLVAAWLRYGRTVLPARTFVRIPAYAAKKIPLYFWFLLRGERKWIRTGRDKRPT
jgi:hypothetical protein